MRVLFALLALAASVATVSAQGWTGPNFYIVGATEDRTAYNFSINGVIVNNPALNLTVGTTYKFILNASMTIHPFGFSGDGNTMSNATDASVGGMTSSGSCALGQGTTLAWITTAGNEANPCILSFTPPASAVGQAPIYYRCSNHGSMKNTMTAFAAAAGSSSSTGGSSTGGSSTGGSSTGTTTAPPTTPSSSTGKSGAAVLVPGAAALLCAAINALFSA